MSKKLSKFGLKCGSRNIPLWMGKNVIGRRSLGAGSRYTSRNHCVIYVIEKKGKSLVILKDVSMNGTYVDTSFVKQKVLVLNENDLIGFGCTLEYYRVTKVESIALE